jgi:hypothetical protein
VLTIAFEAAPGGTRVTWHQRFDSEEHFAEIKDFVAEANEQVLARLEAVIAQ